MVPKSLNLGEVLKDLQRGEIQLPDFQRNWTWDDKQIKSLLESVIRNFPINSIMLLECNAENTKFASRPIIGAENPPCKPQYLILDGQQRLTSLYGVFFSDKSVTITNGKSCKEFFYYVDMQKALDVVNNSANVEGLIISVPSSRKLKAKGVNLDLSTPEKEIAASMFPLNKVFDSRKWLRAYEKSHGDDVAEQFVDEFEEKIINKICAYKIVAIELNKNTSLEAVCKIFENVNRGGEKLGTFDLLTAIFAANKTPEGKSIALRKDFDEIKKIFSDQNLQILSIVEPIDFFTALALLVSYGNRSGKNSVSCKSEDILNLSCNDYFDRKDDLTGGFAEAGKFLVEEGIVAKKYLAYKPQLIPLAAVFTELNRTNKNNAVARKKIRQWYWCAVFTESYRDGASAQSARDFVQLMNWINRNKTPESIENIQINAADLLKVKNLNSAIYKGIVAIIFQNGAKDFLAGRNMGSAANYADGIEIHHIFPKKYCDAHGFPKDKYDSIANKTLIMRATNRTIGDDPPSVYLEKIQRKTGLNDEEINEILECHFIDAELCRADNFDAFIVARAKKIFAAIENLIGRKIIGAPL